MTILIFHFISNIFFFLIRNIVISYKKNYEENWKKEIQENLNLYEEEIILITELYNNNIKSKIKKKRNE